MTLETEQGYGIGSIFISSFLPPLPSLRQNVAIGVVRLGVPGYAAAGALWSNPRSSARSRSSVRGMWRCGRRPRTPCRCAPSCPASGWTLRPFKRAPQNGAMIFLWVSLQSQRGHLGPQCNGTAPLNQWFVNPVQTICSIGVGWKWKLKAHPYKTRPFSTTLKGTFGSSTLGTSILRSAQLIYSYIL